MTEDFPIYQMVWATDANDYLGLAFSSEPEDEQLALFQQPLFVVPAAAVSQGARCYMPGEKNGEQVDFMFTWKGDQLVLDADQTDWPISFALYEMLLLPYSLQYQYIGKEKYLTRGYEYFQILIPLDLLVMDQLFLKDQTCFVGLTPVFGLNNRSSLNIS